MTSSRSGGEGLGFGSCTQARDLLGPGVARARAASGSGHRFQRPGSAGLRRGRKRRKRRKLGEWPRSVKSSRRRTSADSPRGTGSAASFGSSIAGFFAAACLALAPASSETVRVGTSGDYAPFSHAEGGRQPEGLDISLLETWAAESGRELEWIRFRWADLVEGLAAGHYDLAAGGITVRPERSAAGRFSVPVAETGAFALARNPERWGAATPLDRPQIRIAVNAGGHLERVARASFPRATLLAVPDNASVIALLAAQQVDAVVTDSAELPHWEAQVEEPLARIGPLSRDRKAWLLRADRGALAVELDRWLLAREADGTLHAARERWLAAGRELGDASRRPAEPLTALIAAVDERLSLMPWVGYVKRRDGQPLEVPEREALVIERALEAVRAAAEAGGTGSPSEAAVEAFFRAQLEVAKAVQWRAVRDESFRPEAPPDLETALRPALLRIGERSARLLLALPDELALERVRAAAQDLRAPYLDDSDRDALAAAIAALR